MINGYLSKKEKKQRLSKARGFSLIELMVALTLFSIVMTISIGTLLVLIDLNAKAQAVYSASTNLSFALDSIAREVRTGYQYHCANSVSAGEALPDPLTNGFADCSTPGKNFLTFTREVDGVRMGYRLNETEGTIEQKEDPDGSGPEEGTNWTPITADEVFIDSFQIIVDNTNVTDNNQPSVDMMVYGYVNNGLATSTDFYVQTHIVQRRLDIL